MSFLHINLPYGIARNKKGEWMAFNRDYLPLGYSKQTIDKQYHVLSEDGIDLPVYHKYYDLTEEILLSISVDTSTIRRDNNGEIYVVWLYTDATNPIRREYFDIYTQRLSILSELIIK